MGSDAHRRWRPVAASWTGCRNSRARRARLPSSPPAWTDDNYKVSTPEGASVVGSVRRDDFLVINRDHEYHNSVAAARAGVGAPVVAYLLDDMLVLGYFETAHLRQ